MSGYGATGYGAAVDGVFGRGAWVVFGAATAEAMAAVEAPPAEVLTAVAEVVAASAKVRL